MFLECFGYMLVAIPYMERLRRRLQLLSFVFVARAAHNAIHIISRWDVWSTSSRLSNGPSGKEFSSLLNVFPATTSS